MGAVELVADKSTKTPFAPAVKAGQRVLRRAEDRGLIIRAVGDALVLAPPLIINEVEIDDLLATLTVAVDETEVELAGEMRRS
jgi:4-aminobutyrate--pyruvate transaminase